MTFSPEKLWELFQKLPEELRSLIFSAKTAENIALVCEKNSIEDEKTTSLIANYVGYVLHGALSPDKFQAVLEKEADLKKDVAEKVAKEITKTIFSPARHLLDKLYQTEALGKNNSNEPEEKKSQLKPDSYRESIE